MGWEVFLRLKAFALWSTSRAPGYQTQNNSTFASTSSSGNALDRASFATGQMPVNDSAIRLDACLNTKPRVYAILQYLQHLE